MNTLAARGISGFSAMLKHYEAHAPLKRVLPELGATGLFLASRALQHYRASSLRG